MKKQHWLIVLCVLLLIVFTACSHKHSYGDWETKKKATCEKEGRKVRECDCGETDEEKIPKLEHKYGQWTVKTQSTCEKEGVQERICEECKATEESKLPKGEHAFGTATVKTEATCLAEGVRESACDVCGTTREEAIPKAEHVYEAVSGNTISCQSTGTVTQRCKVCGDTRTETAAVKTYTATELYERYRGSVGMVITYDKRGQTLSLGSCFVQTADGKLITNYHVIENAYSAKVTLGDQTYEVQKVLGYDKNIDAAVLQISATGLQPVTLCELEHKVGETVYALGNSQGLESTFSDGIIAYSKRESGGVTYVQHSAPISGGNSGGPLINAYGEVIGINTLTLRDSQNLNFAVCIAELKNLDYSKPVTLSQLYDAENNAYKRLADYVLAYGEQSEGDYYLTLREGRSATLGVNCELFVIYTPADGELLICFGAQKSDYVYILLDENVSGAYEWGYFNVDDDEMSGTIYANTFAENVLLGYDYHNFTNNSRLSAARELASRLMYGMCINLTGGLTDIGLTAADLGFVNF